MGQERRERRLVKAVDTNVLARFLTRDEPRQADRAEEVLRAGAFVPVTVLLETVWLLRSRYGLNRRDAARAVDRLIELPTVEVDDPDLIRWALARSVRGADIADMLHLIGGRSREAFLTFDKKIAPAAGSRSPVPIETLRD